MSNDAGKRAGCHALRIRIYYADTDAGGIVYHSRYLDFAERCRAEMLRDFGWPLVGPAGEGFVVRRASVDWIAPARLDDLLTCSTSMERLGAATVDLRHGFALEGRAVCEIRASLVHVSARMRPLRIPPRLRALFGGLGG